MPTDSTLSSTGGSPGYSNGADPARLADVAIRAALGICFALVAGFYIRSAIDSALKIDWATPSLPLIAEAFSIAVIATFTLLIAWLFVIRLPPLRKSSGIWPRFAALVGGFLNFALVMLPRSADLSVGVKLFSSGLILLGNGLAVAVLLQLGRSFSIMPEARKLVTAGAYGIVRHPLYLAEFIGTVGAVIQFLSPWAIAIVSTQFAFQLVRMHYEERILTASFPEYGTYRNRTARLIPGIY